MLHLRSSVTSFIPVLVSRFLTDREIQVQTFFHTISKLPQICHESLCNTSEVKDFGGV